MSYVRPNIEKMSPYLPGEQPQGGGFIKLNTNENPYPPSPRALEAMRSRIGAEIRLYPDPVASPLRRAASALHGVGEENIIAGNGSDDLLAMIFRCFVEPGESVAWPSPTYSLYSTLAEIQGARAIEVPFPEDYILPEKGLMEAGAKVVFLANPNSPSGTFTERSVVADFASKLDGILVVDEAYVDFADDDCMGLATEAPNVIVLRTFSKSFSMCGLRIGYAVGSGDLIGAMMKVKDSYNVNTLAVHAAAAALDDIEYMRENAAKIKSTRARLADELDRMGFRCLPSRVNFILARAPEGCAAGEIYLKLKYMKILVRYFDTPALRDYLRITIGTDEEIDRLTDALARILS